MRGSLRVWLCALLVCAYEAPSSKVQYSESTLHLSEEPMHTQT